MRYLREDDFWPLGGVGGMSDLATLPWQRMGFKSTTTSAAREEEAARGDGGGLHRDTQEQSGPFLLPFGSGAIEPES